MRRQNAFLGTIEIRDRSRRALIQACGNMALFSLLSAATLCIESLSGKASVHSPATFSFAPLLGYTIYFLLTTGQAEDRSKARATLCLFKDVMRSFAQSTDALLSGRPATSRS